MPTCTSILTARPELFETLKLAHAEKDYARIIESPLIPPFVSQRARLFLDELRPEMEKIVRGEKKLPRWAPRKVFQEENLFSHVESLELCYTTWDVPLVILSDLGSFRQDPQLVNRIAHIFSTKNTFLVNASGTGKTRLLYEGLCKHWGLYFTVGVDSSALGSEDMGLILDLLEGVSGPSAHICAGPRLVDLSKAPEDAAAKNATTMFDVVSANLLARLLVLQQFLELSSSSGITEEHKKRWLLAQLSPHLFDRPYPAVRLIAEPFQYLSQILISNDLTYVRQNIADALRKIRKLLGNDEHLFCTLDQTQAAVPRGPQFFNDGKTILPELLKVWQSHLGSNWSVIAAGTKIPKSLFDGDGEDYVWCSATGAFDTREAQDRYVLRFFPPNYATSASGRVLMTRIWDWLRGRHRYTASFVAALLKCGFERPHIRLNDYVEEHSKLEPFDAMDEIGAENPDRGAERTKMFLVPNYPSIADEPTILPPILEVLLRYMATQKDSPAFGPDFIGLVNWGCGRFADSEMSTVVVDEPMTVVGAARGLFRTPGAHYMQPYRSPSTFLGAIIRTPPHNSETLSYVIAFYLAQVLSPRWRLCDIFTFPGEAPVWAKQPAELVRLIRANGRKATTKHVVVTRDDSLPFVTNAESVEDVLSWLDHRHESVFCRLPSDNTDLLFCLKLADDSFAWVALRAIASAGPLSDDELRTAISLMGSDSLLTDEAILKKLEALPHRSSALGDSSLLRIVSAFPTEIDLKECVEEGCNDVASLDMALLEDTNAEIPQPVFFDKLLAGVLAGLKRKAPAAPTQEGKLSKRRRHSDGVEDEPRRPPAAVKGKGKARATQEQKTTRKGSPVAEASGSGSAPRRSSRLKAGKKSKE
ncbi:hypothetical protein C8R46DRAFT_1078619 [Mycena filopes]|nr:hypothetical protein C8R46DRAFT_1078619 [Mycena filopes]